jgi:hypothetical protein
MNDPIADRAAAIRHYLAALDKDPSTARRYPFLAARLEQLRLACGQGTTTPGDDARV